MSTDRTVELANELGAKVTQRAFDGYARQRNAGLHQINYKHPWVLILDADEIVPEALRIEMETFVSSAPEGVVACRIRRRDFFMGRWLKHAQMSPFFVRLVMPNRVRYEREVNEVLIADGEIVDLKNPFDHFPFSKGITHWVDKHNRYSSMEAQELVRQRAAHKPSLKSALFERDFNNRRVAQKAIFYRMPLRPLVKWLFLVIAKRAFLDGKPGMTYARLMMIYEYLIDLKAKEIESS
ncbi:glycosyl transferase, group 2 family [Fimbriimonas ginsengisoli Gsoil 348]|uniref:Glycosyl transferase, group 2 family n=2 Tax=Fimbriimonas ginsengisoli TaxID=1005039 RepID=A0A068NT03_FIMGI|nr:glycosyl transferase, group 2 family [Fimbriimonas ginsengisoli Gsoil 348]